MMHSKYFVVALLITGLAAVDTPAQSNSETEPPAWRSTLERISSGVVSIKVDSTRAFDTGWMFGSAHSTRVRRLDDVRAAKQPDLVWRGAPSRSNDAF